MFKSNNRQFNNKHFNRPSRSSVENNPRGNPYNRNNNRGHNNFHNYNRVKLATDEAAGYPLAAKALLTDTYVDDVLTGADTVDELSELRSQLIKLLSHARLFAEGMPHNTFEVIEKCTRVKVRGKN
ncbi:hypothetical protein NQ317_003545 [Molorchus minor]|uniref:Uncharacterized protein n=1 Tax=Molorchus minor TaxID=1323400 RepID=A0ABQ9IX45_9CUCU|nr:hypothetical protein NQ317_003545 [Molorchus minor]